MAMRKARVLVVDDSGVIRQVLSRVLGGDPELDLVGTAATGVEALDKIATLDPDVVTLDVEMPGIDGIETLRRLRVTHPHLPVIMFSTLTERGAAMTLDALAAGATAYATKPVSKDFQTTVARLQEDLLDKVRFFATRYARRREGRVSQPPVALGRPQVVPSRAPEAPPRPAPVAVSPLPAPALPSVQPLGSVSIPSSAQRPTSKVEILVIGASTGGPNAVHEIVSALPQDLPVPVLIVQHMPPVFTRLFAERLDTLRRLRVGEAIPGALLEPGRAWVAPGDYHMVLERSRGAVRVVTNQAPPEQSVRPAVDPLLRSVVEIYGAGVLAVVLTGMGKDGLDGCGRVKQAGGHVVVQDEATSVVWGMPGFVARAGLADAMLPIDRIAMEIVRLVQLGRPLTASPALAAAPAFR